MPVWSDNAEVRKNVLLTTKGGYPHITLGYCGKSLNVCELTAEAMVALNGPLLLRKVRITSARVNSFDLNRGKGVPNMRHDVLMYLDDSTNDAVQEARDRMCEDHEEGTFSMGEPHIHARYLRHGRGCRGACTGDPEDASDLRGLLWVLQLIEKKWTSTMYS